MRFLLSNFGNGFSFKWRNIIGDLKYNTQIHQFIEIHFVIEDTVELTVDSEKRILEQGDFAVIHPFRRHSLLTNPKTKMWIGVFSDDLVKSLGTLSLENAWGEDFVFRGSDSLVNYVKEHIPSGAGNISIEPNSPLRYTLGAIFFAVMDEFKKSTPQTQVPVHTTALAKIFEFIEIEFISSLFTSYSYFIQIYRLLYIHKAR